MANGHPTPRRRVLQILAGSALVNLTPRCGAAEDGEQVNESDSLAVQLKYRRDSADAKERNNAADHCGVCAFYQGGTAPVGACIVFGGKRVNRNGWCTSFRARG